MGSPRKSAETGFLAKCQKFLNEVSKPLPKIRKETISVKRITKENVSVASAVVEQVSNLKTVSIALFIPENKIELILFKFSCSHFQD